jgi:hypothetical protein
MAANPQLGDSEKVPFTLIELDAASFPATPNTGDVASVTSASPSITVVMDATPVAGTVASGFLVGGTPAPGVVITAQVTHADGTVLGPITDTIDVVGGTASSLSIGLGAPVPK